MSDTIKKRKALALFSGGLDSTLAIKLIVDQGVEVVACHINTGFGATQDRQAHMEHMCAQLGVELLLIDIQNEYLQNVLFSPKYGYGKHFNPCIDCHAKMFEVAKEMMQDLNADFLITGEVLGQRPMSQNSEALNTVLKEADVEGLLLRPLSAQKLPETMVEKEGWVDRERLEAIEGRSRDRQLELVDKYGIKDYESPGGGCLLTDANFTIKLVDYIKYDSDFNVTDIPVLKWGRHLRLPDGAKMVVGRKKDENAYLRAIDNKKFIHITTSKIPGPHTLLSRDATPADRDLALRAVLTYCKTVPEAQYTLIVDGKKAEAKPFTSRTDASRYNIL